MADFHSPQQHVASTPERGTGFLRSLTATWCNSSTLFLVGKETALILLPSLALSPPLLHFNNTTFKDSCSAPLLGAQLQTPQGAGRSKAELRAGSVRASAAPLSCKEGVQQDSLSYCVRSQHITLADPFPKLGSHRRDHRLTLTRNRCSGNTSSTSHGPCRAHSEGMLSTDFLNQAPCSQDILVTTTTSRYRCACSPHHFLHALSVVYKGFQNSA